MALSAKKAPRKMGGVIDHAVPRAHQHAMVVWNGGVVWDSACQMVKTERKDICMWRNDHIWEELVRAW